MSSSSLILAEILKVKSLFIIPLNPKKALYFSEVCVIKSVGETKGLSSVKLLNVLVCRPPLAPV